MEPTKAVPSHRAAVDSMSDPAAKVHSSSGREVKPPSATPVSRGLPRKLFHRSSA